VNGVFDDCQEMVKLLFLDEEITKTLTSANSINVAVGARFKQYAQKESVLKGAQLQANKCYC
jgi:threonine synthase